MSTNAALLGMYPMVLTRPLFIREYLKVLAPALFAALLFLVVLFGAALPAAQEQLLRQKKQMITSVVDTAWSILASYEQRAVAGEFSRSRAMELAAGQIRSLRYGSEGKDYFWINDLRPVMIMHPYRKDLEGAGLGTYVDPGGTPLFRNMVDTVLRQGSGYVEYLWQWKDEPTQVGPKLSYVKLFQPWRWIVGTGVYLDDVASERRAILREVSLLSLAVLAMILGMSAFILHNALQEVRRRLEAEAALTVSQDRLRSLLDERTARLQSAETRVKALHGLLPLCMSCKKIRDDKGYWNQLELYIRDHSDAEISHGLCPECAERLYPGHYRKDPTENP
jgi:hypothetical protein